MGAQNGYYGGAFVPSYYTNSHMTSGNKVYVVVNSSHG